MSDGHPKDLSNCGGIFAPFDALMTEEVLIWSGFIMITNLRDVNFSSFSNYISS
jgi:hypothetical protein